MMPQRQDKTRQDKVVLAPVVRSTVRQTAPEDPVLWAWVTELTGRMCVY